MVFGYRFPSRENGSWPRFIRLDKLMTTVLAAPRDADFSGFISRHSPSIDPGPIVKPATGGLWLLDRKTEEESEMKDMDLRQSVLDELEFEPSIDAADIGVTAENAVITLTGHVQSYVQKIAAERAVWRVKGVKGLAQRIEVRLPGDSRINDDELAERALNVLSWASSGLRDTVKVRVANGWITLTGRVKWNYQRTMAESEVRKLTG